MRPRRLSAVLVPVLVAGLLGAPTLAPPTAAQSAAPGPEAGSPPPDVGYIGDSLGVESQEEIVAAFHRRRPVEVVAVANGAYVSWVRRHWLRSILRDPPSILVVGLGHADANKYIPPPEFDRQVRAFLAELTPHVDCIRWLNVRRRTTYYPPVNDRSAAYNRILRQAAARHPEVEVVDYSAWVDLVGNRRFERDRMHLTPVGEQAFARLVRQAADSCDPTLTTGPFRDVPDHDPAAPAAAWLHQQGIARDDHGDRTFRARLADADVPLLRRDLARWLWRAQGRPTGSPLPVWTDVPFELWEPVAWLAEQRLVAGLPGGRFGPDRPVRRAELVRALWLLAGRPAPVAAAPWPDVPAGLALPFAWAAEAGVITGYGDGTVRPRAVLTRSVAARALAPDDLPPPAPRPTLGGPYPPPRRLGGDARAGV